MSKSIIAGLVIASLSWAASAASPQAVKGPAPKEDLVLIQTGADLYDRCGAFMVILKKAKPDSPDGALKADACLSYVHGFLDGEQITALVETMRKSGMTGDAVDTSAASAFCVPGQLQQSDVVKTIVAFLGGHPEERSKPVAAAIYAALEDAYPCLPR